VGANQAHSKITGGRFMDILLTALLEDASEEVKQKILAYQKEKEIQRQKEE
jgi:hypothetical protein